MDPVHLRQILWNLMLNAAEAIEGRGTIGVEVRATRNGKVEIRIRDSGCGIPPELMESVFNPFFTTKAEGTGLGLSVVHRLLESYDSLPAGGQPGRPRFNVHPDPQSNPRIREVARTLTTGVGIR